MTTLDRRHFLRAAAAGAALAAFPESIRRALALPANNTTGTIKDVQHVVILTQENRSFDHYFGTLPGVRGFGDRFTIPQPAGASVWQQGDGQRSVMPYYLDSSQGNALSAGGPHSWSDAHQAWDGGRMTNWPQYKGDVSMGYLKQKDLDYQFALAEAFTVCDAYHCSLHGGTNSNRIHLWSGANHGSSAASNCGRVAVVNNGGWDGVSTTPLADSLSWTTYPERLQAAGVSWKVYQNLPNNYTDNPLAGFLNYRNAYQQVNGSLDNYSSGLPAPKAYTPTIDAAVPLYKGIGNTMPDDGGTFLSALKADIASGQLPQVSWVVGPPHLCEHPGASTPGQGAWYMQQLLEALTANAEVWSKTVLLVNYDENDCFFDHMPPPNPPSPDGSGGTLGSSTVDTSLDYFNLPAAPGGSNDPSDGLPYGAGPRVPMLVISPWSRGGWVNSQVFDHTSVLRFLEQRFGVAEANITPWRRAVFGDLTSAFNFATPNDVAPSGLPLQNLAVVDLLWAEQNAAQPVPVPAASSQTPPVQPAGTRPSRALPYELHVSASADVAGSSIWLIHSNSGAAGAVFHVYDQLHLDRQPRRYTVEAGRQLADSWDAGADGGTYHLWVLGPNGFHREFQGGVGNSSSAAEIRVCYDVANNAVYLTLMNTGSSALTFTVTSKAYRTDGPWDYPVPAHSQVEPYWNLGGSGGWYDFSVSAPGGFMRRFAGRLETGRDSISDPAMGAGGAG